MTIDNTNTNTLIVNDNHDLKLDMSQVLSGYDPLTDSLADFMQVKNGDAVHTVTVNSDGKLDSGYTNVVSIYHGEDLNIDDLVNSATHTGT